MKEDRGKVEISAERCKGCLLCVEVCPQKLIKASSAPNSSGYYPAAAEEGGCTGCGMCYIVCPEPGCVKVFAHERRAEGGKR